jgi:hypothetical protein
MPKTPEKSPPDILEILRKMGDDYICKPRNMKGKELIKHAGLIWAANHLDPNWESECELVYFDLETGSAVVRATVTVNGSRKVNFGEAAQNNLGPMVKVYPVSMASTRALSRALKNALNIALVSFEEIGILDDSTGQPSNVAGGPSLTPTGQASEAKQTTHATPAAFTPSRPPDHILRRPNPHGDHEPGDPCPSCGSEMWDNRETKRNPRAPDFKCKDRECGKAIWLTPRPAASSAPIDPDMPF